VSKYPEQEVLLTAHLDEIGADDNGSGSASLLEMARTLNYLIDKGPMPPDLGSGSHNRLELLGLAG
jgi:Zn-dependent M28 family amino/carboxypeptidase